MHLDLLSALNEERRARRPAVLATHLHSGAQRLARATDLSAPSSDSDPFRAALVEALRTGSSGCVTIAGEDYFLAAHMPPPRLVLIGAGHIAQALSIMALMTGFDVFVVDPRSAFATPARFPHCPIFADWPDNAPPMQTLDGQTAVATLAHDPKIDDPALRLALAAPCFYIGALGSRHTHQKRLQRLAAHVPTERLSRIQAPIGLDIGALTPQEIAVSILAELIGARKRKPFRRQPANP